ncbi:MAG: non-reducing end alpha-L-arabinofuranosidase family hydrolase [Bacteroidota bacterium]
MLLKYNAFAQDSCGIQWQPALQMSPSGQGLLEVPKIATQGDTVHLFFATDSFRIAYRRSVTNGESWDSLRDIISDSLHNLFFTGNIFPTTDGKRLYVFFLNEVGADEQRYIYMTYSDNRGDDWTQPKAINDTTSFIRSVAVLGDSIAIFGLFSGHGYDRTIFSTDEGETWKYGQEAILQGIGVSDASIALTNGWLHIVYHHNFEVEYRRSSDLGNTWNLPMIISDDDNFGSIEAEMVAQPEGNLFVVWRDCKYGCVNGFAGSIVFRKSTDNGNYWKDEIPLTDTAWGVGSQLSIQDFVVAVSWFADHGIVSHIETRLSFSQGENWCPLVDITPPESYDAVVSDIVVNKRSVAVTWEQRDSLNDNFHTEVRSGKLPIISVNEPLSSSPIDVLALPTFPNPFNSTTVIAYKLPSRGNVRVEIINILGQEIITVFEGYQEAGEHQAIWNASEFPSGLYIARIRFEKQSVSQKIILTK